MKKISFCVKSSIALSLIVLISNLCQAQSAYKLLLKGERSPYDSAVVIHLPTYRVETTKLRLGDKLIDSLAHEIDLSNDAISILYEKIDNQSIIIDTQARANERKDSIVFGVVKNYEELQKIATAPDPPTPFWHRPGVIWATAGFVFIVVQGIKLFGNGD